MNKNAIKKFAIAARTRLIATVSDKAGTLGITRDGIAEPVEKGNGFKVYKTSAGTEIMLQGGQIEQHRRLVSQVRERGFDVIIEEVAYTWFNRICAIRFMEVNDYLPTRVRVLSSLKAGKNEPDLLTEAPEVDLGFTDKEREWILNAKAENRLDELFSMLFIKQCNKLSEILPEMFGATEDYTEMLLSLSYTNKDDVIHMLVDGLDDADFNVTSTRGSVEIIGWLYQYYNTELKDDTLAQLKKNVKISKEHIPAATQLFTPDWIVHYMVENCVGHIWIEHLRAVNPDTDEKATAESFGWKYYLLEAKQEPEVDVKLAEIRKSYAELKPEDILCIDPCMGSGHILVAMFDVLMDIYKSVGYGEREAAFEIVEHNLHGLDIDKRAYQLAYFAVMMRGRQYNRRFFRGKEEGQRPQPKVYAFVESNDVNRVQLQYFGAGLSETERNDAVTQMNGLLDTFVDAREYGSILNVDQYDWDFLRRFIAETNDDGQMTLDTVGLPQAQETMKKLIDIGEVLARKYNAVVTNPPYMGGSNMNPKLSEFIKKNYAEYKSDLFSAFIVKCTNMNTEIGYAGFLSPYVWMFIQSYEKLRDYIYHVHMIQTLIQFEYSAFEEATVPIYTFVIKSEHIDKNGCYLRLTDFRGGMEIQRKRALEAIENHDCGFYYEADARNFEKIPGMPVAYWSSKGLQNIFEKGKTIGELYKTVTGSSTGENARFLKLWYEVEENKIGLGLTAEYDGIKYKWIPCNKGGSFRRWYGNNEYVIDWHNDGAELKAFATKKQWKALVAFLKKFRLFL